MTDSTPCYWIEPTETGEVWLRRYASPTQAPEPGHVVDRIVPPCAAPRGYHNADVCISARVPLPLNGDGTTGPFADDEVPHDDPRWPAKCDACDYRFEPADHWQVNKHMLYRCSDGRPDITLQPYTPEHRAEIAGAMWDASWMGEHYRGPDGLHLLVVTPGGDWPVDGTATNGPGWTRTGDPRNPASLTVRPSILIGSYHAFLTNGVLVPV